MSLSHILRLHAALLVFSLFHVAYSQNQLPQYDPLKDFCRRFAHQTTVIDNKLYIDGGLVDYGGGITPSTINYTNTYLLYLDLDQLQATFPIEYDNLTKPSNVPSVQGGALWADIVNKKFYLYGGEYNSSISPPSQYTLWAYDVLSNSWNATPDGSDASGIQSASFGAGTVIDDRALAFYYGGWLSNASVWGWNGGPMAQSGLLRYDMIGNEWQNLTFVDSTPRAEGLMVYIPASDAGMLVYFGGVEETSNGSYTGVAMNQIYLYDIGIGKSYIQTTSGPTPPMRRRFCGGVTWAQDQSSYNIYLYGGLPPYGQEGLGYGDVWILSMPSFTWTQWYNDTADGSQHHSLSCNVIDQSQMIIMGGYFPNSSNIGCDAKSIWGQHNLNLGANDIANNEWYQFETNITSYQVPTTLYDAIGGGPTGGATLTTPASGWGDPALEVYFTRHYSPSTRTPTRPLGPSSTSAAPSSTSAAPIKPHSNVGAIAGGTVGGVAVLVGLVLVIWLGLKRRIGRQSAPTNELAAPSHKPSQSPHVSEMPNSSPAFQYKAHQGDAQSPNAASYRGSPPPAFADSGWSQVHPPQTPTAQQPQHYYPPPSQAQPFYPPPPEPQSHDQAGYSEHPLFPVAEMPNVRSPEQRRP